MGVPNIKKAIKNRKESKSFSLEEIVNNLEENIQDIEKQSENIFIVNAGRMNHGKSSLFNALLDQTVFATGDVRTTVERSDAEFRPGIFLVDTPGLDAVDCDDKVAFDAYKKANMVVFVHTPNIGEMHKDEIDRINQIKALFPTEKYFWNHFCLVLTFTEAIEKENLEKIEAKILADIKEQCKGEQFKVFHVSNIRYNRGKKENKTALIKSSGINELRDFLNDNIIKWQAESDALKEEKISKLIDEAQSKLKMQYKNLEALYNEKHTKLEADYKDVLNTVNSVFYEIEDCREYLQSNLQEVSRLKIEVRELTEQHNREKY